MWTIVVMMIVVVIAAGGGMTNARIDRERWYLGERPQCLTVAFTQVTLHCFCNLLPAFALSEQAHFKQISNYNFSFMWEYVVYLFIYLLFFIEHRIGIARNAFTINECASVERNGSSCNDNVTTFKSTSSFKTL